MHLPQEYTHSGPSEIVFFFMQVLFEIKLKNMKIERLHKNAQKFYLLSKFIDMRFKGMAKNRSCVIL